MCVCLCIYVCVYVCVYVFVCIYNPCLAVFEQNLGALGSWILGFNSLNLGFLKRPRHKTPSSFSSTDLENHEREMREEESWRRNHGASILGGLWEASGKHLGGI